VESCPVSGNPAGKDKEQILACRTKIDMRLVRHASTDKGQVDFIGDNHDND